MKITQIIQSLSLVATAVGTQYAIANTTDTAPQPKSAEACVGLQANSDRLACYDAFFQPHTPTMLEQDVAKPQPVDAPDHLVDAAALPEPTVADTIAQIPSIVADNFFGDAPEFNPQTSLFDQRWELSEDSKLGTWQLRAYQPMYVLPLMWTTDKNELPYSPNPTNRVTEAQDLRSLESKFQISFKTKAMEDIFGDNGDLWVGYTQSSRWQVYNEETSRPFRETNYEPEASLIFRTNYNLLGLNGRLLGLTFNHQSNGRSDPFSRSWNRLILNVGLERDNFALMIRPWYRLEEDAKDDNNPDIKNYIGRGDMTAFYKWKDHNFSLMLRHSLKGGEDSHGAAQFDWAFPLSGNLRGHLQVFEGYGESLIDYNHKATYVGLGVSLMNWF